MSIAACTTYLNTRYSVGRFADATFVDGAVFQEGALISTILGTAHAGTPAGTQPDADARLSYYQLALFRSIVPTGDWDSPTIYNAANWAPLAVYRRTGVAVGWSGHTFHDPGTNLYPKDDGTPGNLLPTPLQLTYGLYFCVLTTEAVGSGVDPSERFAGLTSNNGFVRIIKFPVTSPATWTPADFSIVNPLDPGTDAEAILQATADGAVPLNQAGHEYQTYDGGGSPPGPWAVCVADAQLVRFRVNRKTWSD